jgi:hypothetical protein
MKELVFEVMQESDGGYTAEALGESIFTQADNWDELKANVREAVQAFYFDSAAPASIRLSAKRGWQKRWETRKEWLKKSARILRRRARL